MDSNREEPRRALVLTPVARFERAQRARPRVFREMPWFESVDSSWETLFAGAEMFLSRGSQEIRFRARWKEKRNRQQEGNCLAMSAGSTHTWHAGVISRGEVFSFVQFPVLNSRSLDLRMRKYAEMIQRADVACPPVLRLWMANFSNWEWARRSASCGTLHPVP